MSGFYPQALFSPTVKDLRAEFQPQAFYGTTSAGSAATSVSHSTLNFFDIPEDKCFLLQQAHAFANAGTGQFAVDARLFIAFRDAGSAIRVLTYLDRWEVESGTQYTGKALNWSGSLPLLARHLIGTTCIFDAGAVTNFVQIAMGGVLIPRGNWAEF